MTSAFNTQARRDEKADNIMHYQHVNSLLYAQNINGKKCQAAIQGNSPLKGPFSLNLDFCLFFELLHLPYPG